MSSMEASGSSKGPVIGDHAALRTYYESQESYLVYEVVLRGSHHFGYYDKDTYWPFPIGRSLQRSEDLTGAYLDEELTPTPAWKPNS